MFTGGVDYTSLSQTLIFTRTTNRQCVRLETIQDEAVEEGEYFLVTLINPDGVSIAGAQTNITIVDDDSRYTLCFMLLICNSYFVFFLQRFW